MREITFRVKSRWNNNWLFFSLPWGCDLSLDKKWDPATCGQFTGLYDKNGRKIYEGDLVRNTKLAFPKVDQIIYAADGYCGFMRKWPNGTLDWIDTVALEIIGNIHENPELLI